MQMKYFIDEFGLSRADVENWLSRPSVQLRTEYAPTAKGRARDFTRKNVMELALVGALVSVGARASEAAIWAKPVIEEYLSVLRTSQVNWIAFPAQSLDQMVTSENISKINLDELSKQSPKQSVVIINAGEILRQVDKIFQLQSENN